MEKHKGWVRYVNSPEERISHEEYYLQYIPKQRELDDHTYIDVSEEIAKDLPDAIYENVKLGKKHLKGDFFIEVIVKNEELLVNNKKNIIVARPTCPSPSFDRIVYHYHADSGEIELLWVLPTLSQCINYYNNGFLSLKEDDRLLAEFVAKYYSGDLDILEREKNSKLNQKKEY